MSAFSQLKSWLRAATRRTRLEDRMDEELAFHLESCIEDLVRRGMPREEATRTAKIEFGNTLTQKEEMRASFGLRWWDDLRADLRYAVRMLANAPGFTLIAVASLALGIGANTAIFSTTKAALLDSVHVSHPNQLRLLEWQIRGNQQPMASLYGGLDLSDAGNVRSTAFTYAAYQALQQDHSAFESLVAFFLASHMEIAWDDEVDSTNVEYVSGNFFSVLGLPATVGRAILPTDDQLGKTPVAVISDAFWEAHFARSPRAIGKMLKINGVPTTIIGVAPSNFDGLFFDRHPAVMLPISMEPVISGGWSNSRMGDADTAWLRVAGRIRPGISNTRAEAALTGILQQTFKTTLKLNRKHQSLDTLKLLVTPGNQGENPWRHEYAKIDVVLTIMVALVLLLACANLANLLLARSIARQRELSLRMALGAGRGRLLRQTFTEAFLLALLGSIAGAAIGYAGRNFAPLLLQQPKPDFDWKVMAFTLCLTLLTALLCGSIPAWHAVRTDAQNALRETSQMTAKRTRTSLAKFFVVMQIGLATLLLVGAGLFVRTLYNLSSVELGFEPQRILLFELSLPATEFPSTADRATAYQQLEERLSAIPGAISATVSTDTLIANVTSTSNFDVDGQPAGEKTAWENIVGDHFFQTMGIPMLSGSGFERQDTPTTGRVAVVNRELANQFFHGQNPIGHTFNSDHTRIIGVCGDTRFRSLRDNVPPTYYLFSGQVADYGPGQEMTFAVKTAANPDAVATSVRKVVHDFRHDLIITHMRTQEELIRTSLQQERTFASLSTGFGLLAIVLASIGIYGIMAYNVSRRTNEIGIRLALGAQARQILTMVLGETSWLAVTGVAVGLGAALLLTRFLKTMLFGLKPTDPLTMIGAGAMLFAVALLAGFIPARRASRVEPMQALRHE
jgi:predicted permease